jgi:hypothetical protein
MKARAAVINNLVTLFYKQSIIAIPCPKSKHSNKLHTSKTFRFGIPTLELKYQTMNFYQVHIYKTKIYFNTF